MQLKWIGLFNILDILDRDLEERDFMLMVYCYE